MRGGGATWGVSISGAATDEEASIWLRRAHELFVARRCVGRFGVADAAARGVASVMARARRRRRGALHAVGRLTTGCTGRRRASMVELQAAANRPSGGTAPSARV
jgi:hypothetical protein